MCARRRPRRNGQAAPRTHPNKYFLQNNRTRPPPSAKISDGSGMTRPVLRRILSRAPFCGRQKTTFSA